VLRDQLEAGREKLIHRLKNDIDTAIFERDKTQAKHQRIRSQNASKDCELINEKKLLLQAKDSLLIQIRVLEENHAQALDSLDRSIPSQSLRIISARNLLTTLHSLSEVLANVRIQVSMLKRDSIRICRSGIQTLRKEYGRIISEQASAIRHNENQRIFAKRSEMADAASKSAALQRGVQALTSFVNRLASSTSLSLRVGTLNPALFQRTLDCVMDAEEKAALKQELHESGMENQDELLQAVRDEYERELQAKDAELAAILAQARRRWRKLQTEFNAALNQIQRLRRLKQSQENALLEDSSYEFETSTRRLDETIRQLGLPPLSRH
jgi:hypothetical protein